MPFEFLDDDLVLLGGGRFADEFRAKVAELNPRPAVVEVRHYPFAGRESDPLIEEISKIARGRLLVVGYLGNHPAVGPLPSAAMDEIFRQDVPGGYAPIRLALLAKYAKRLEFRPTALRHVVRSGQERQGCLSGGSEAGVDVEELQLFVRMQRFGPPNPDLDALILKSGAVEVIESTTLPRVPRVIARFEAGEAPTATLVCRRSRSVLETRYIDPLVVEACARLKFKRLTVVGGDAVFEDWPQVEGLCRRSGLRLYRFFD